MGGWEDCFLKTYLPPNNPLIIENDKEINAERSETLITDISQSLSPNFESRSKIHYYSPIKSKTKCSVCKDGEELLRVGQKHVLNVQWVNLEKHKVLLFFFKKIVKFFYKFL